MIKYNYINLEQGTNAWLAYRTNGVGGSDIASIAGMKGAFNKRSDVMAEKLGATKKITDFQKKIFADGHEWEALVRENLNSTGYNFKPAVVCRNTNERLFASLDGLDEQAQKILEVKSVVTRERFEDYCERIPDHYMAQVQWQLMVCEYDTAMVAFVHGGEVVIREVQANHMMQVDLFMVAVAFLKELDGIKAGTLPSPIQSVEGSEMDRLAYLKAQEKEMKVQLDMVSEEIKQLAERVLETNKANRIEGKSVTVQWVERQGSIDYAKVPELKGIDLAPYRKKGSRFVQVNLKGGEA